MWAISNQYILLLWNGTLSKNNTMKLYETVILILGTTTTTIFAAKKYLQIPLMSRYSPGWRWSVIIQLGSSGGNSNCQTCRVSIHNCGQNIQYENLSRIQTLESWLYNLNWSYRYCIQQLTMDMHSFNLTSKENFDLDSALEFYLKDDPVVFWIALISRILAQIKWRRKKKLNNRLENNPKVFD